MKLHIVILLLIVYPVYSSNWNTTNITWHTTTDIPIYKFMIDRAFTEWSKHFNFKFTNVKSNANIIISFSSGSHWIYMANRNCPYDFSSLDYVFGHTYYMEKNNSDIHINLKFADLYKKNPYELFTLMLHEIGHSLGLHDNNRTDSIMCGYKTFNKKGISSYDIDSLIGIYGSKIKRYQTYTNIYDMQLFPPILLHNNSINIYYGEFVFNKHFKSTAIFRSQINERLPYVYKHSDINGITVLPNNDVMYVVKDIGIIYDGTSTKLFELPVKHIFGLVTLNNQVYILYNKHYYVIFDPDTHNISVSKFITNKFLLNDHSVNKVYNYFNNTLCFVKKNVVYLINECIL